ncbi:MAG: hypothetical protein WDW36_005759 [Sanguina aurantia]
MDEDIEELYSKLHACTKKLQHSKVLKVADEILTLIPGDVDALRCKVTAFIQTSDFEAAMSLLCKTSSFLPEQVAFDKAYCLYRQGKVVEALAMLQSVPEDLAVGALQLEAQLRYRLGQSGECIQLYDKLFQNHKVDSLELKTNVLAAYVSASLASEIPALMTAMKVNSKQSFELGFNKACGLAEVGELAAAENELRLALKLGRETLFEEECSEEEVEDELAPLTTQLAYVLGRMGRMPEAQELYDTLLRGSLELSDVATKAIAANNVVADEGQRIDSTAANKKFVSSSTKKAELLVERGTGLRFVGNLESRLSPQQQLALHLNRALLYVASGRDEQARGLAASLAAAHGDVAQVVMLQAVVSSGDGKLQDADRNLESFCGRMPASSLLPTLMRAQMALEAGNLDAGSQLLNLASAADPRVLCAGGVVATQVALLEQVGDFSGAEVLLQQSLALWRAQGAAHPHALEATMWCLHALVSLKLKLGKVAEATSSYTQLAALLSKSGDSGSSQSMEAAGLLARLARALAAVDAGAAPALERLAAAVPGGGLTDAEVDALEDASRNVASIPKKYDPASKKRGGDAVQQQPKAKKVKKKKPRFPVGYDPALPGGGLPAPDPERWLPKWQRAEAKKKAKKRRDKEAVKGSQGAGKVDESLDRTKAVEVPKEAKKETKPAPSKKGKGRR